MSATLYSQPDSPPDAAPGVSSVNQRTHSRDGRPLVLVDDLETVFERLLAEQENLTAVERFAQLVDESAPPLQARYYRSLLPASAPGPGEQYAFEVDLDRCSGCKACVTACHNLNGLDSDETWRDVGLLHGVSIARSGSDPLPLLQHVTTACHHCVEPGCLAACPTQAYEKEEATGIVRHLDDQCFGCQYCTLACPYGVPKYHAAKGIVRKCDLCANRLKAGEAPACVQACPHEAIRVHVVSKGDAAARAARGQFLPATPAPHHTTPTTVYKSSRLDLSAARAADADALIPDHAHPPLILMLVLTQMAVGMSLVDAILSLSGSGIEGRGLGFAGRLTTVAIANVGLACATLHLGRPWLAFRAILGWRTSWLSREALVFGLYMQLAVSQLAVEWFFPTWWSPLLSVATAAAGLAGVWCSIMIYAVCPRPLWALPLTAARFLATTLGLGCAGTNSLWLALPLADSLTSSRLVTGSPATMLWCALVSGSVLVWRLVADVRLVRGHESDWTGRVRKLLMGPLRTTFTTRGWLSAAGELLLVSGVIVALGTPFLGAVLTSIAVLASFGLILRVSGEICERWLFFAASTTPRMPGGVTV